MTGRLAALSAMGTSVWLDYIHRDLVRSSELDRFIAEDSVVGMTSNPTIFEKAIAGSNVYDADIRAFVAEGLDVERIYERLAIADIQAACGGLQKVYKRTDGLDGYVSLEVAPRLAYDTRGTIDEAHRLWGEVGRENLLIKVPATAAGVPAVRALIADGINVNVTLIFSVERYGEVMEAYLSGLESRQADGKPLLVASVASFFVSRLDTLVDSLLQAKADGKGADKVYLASLAGRAAVANAKVAYERFQSVFGGPRFRALASQGARVQRPLWASTSTKNPSYRDVIYVEELTGPDCVNTMPLQTLEAYRDHGVATRTVDRDVEAAHSALNALSDAGIDLAAVTKKLEDDGVEAFETSFRDLMASLSAKRALLLLPETKDALQGHQGLVAAASAEIAKIGALKRLWSADPSLWSTEPAVTDRVASRLGWLQVVGEMRREVSGLRAFGEEIRAEGVNDVVLLGMGGSSLGPEVIAKTFGPQPGFPVLTVLDSTDPSQVLAVRRRLDLSKTLFLVSSKSGTTTEVQALFAYFYGEAAAVVGASAGRRFIAITDPGTALERLAAQVGFRRVFLNRADIGGRYSVLSYFGLVPAALAGVDVGQLVDSASLMVSACGRSVPIDANPGFRTGAAIGSLAKAGIDKLTFVCSPGIASFGIWAEQLVAESTGKQGKGIVPVAGEPLGEPSSYGQDRLFVYLRLHEPGVEEIDRGVEALEQAGYPVLYHQIRDRYDVAAEFFRWELATAVAGLILGVNPFDEPNVQESKDITRQLLAAFEESGTLPNAEAERFIHAKQGRTNETPTYAAEIAELTGLCRQGDYVGILGYFPPSNEVEREVAGIRAVLRDQKRLATTFGYGPRYLHSTGQLHKGGPNSGVFLVLTAEAPSDVPIPESKYGFSLLERAQALGDLGALRGHGRRAVRIHLGADVVAGLRRIRESLDSVLAARAT